MTFLGKKVCNLCLSVAPPAPPEDTAWEGGGAVPPAQAGTATAAVDLGCRQVVNGSRGSLGLGQERP